MKSKDTFQKDDEFGAITAYAKEHKMIKARYIGEKAIFGLKRGAFYTIYVVLEVKGYLRPRAVITVKREGWDSAIEYRHAIFFINDWEIIR